MLAVTDEHVEQYLLRPKARLTEAPRDSQVEVIRVAIDDDVQARVASARRLQTMTGGERAN